jgi:hypothetical protein
MRCRTHANRRYCAHIDYCVSLACSNSYHILGHGQRNALLVVRYLPKTMKRSLSIYLLWGSLSLAGCLDLAGECEIEAVSRKSNSSKTCQAIKCRIDCGATTTPSGSLRIVENTDTTDLGSPEQTIHGTGPGFDFEWKSNDTLVVHGIDTAVVKESSVTYKLVKSKGNITVLLLPGESGKHRPLR